MTKAELFPQPTDYKQQRAAWLKLAEVCPKKFREENSWTTYARHCCFNNYDTSRWQWRSDLLAEREHQLACFRELIGAFNIMHQTKMMLACWMLSKMLHEVPK